ncbi:hypothetical protein EJ03DRAFT_326320 [Teratosphaeria nubilosa]|uniref:Dynein light intermediate chain n=1 Tax=Teratosphaeria nubilosa TaxID=161662 RepID=A0A6G1LDM1_9PEZI|nr:hypothetical protein EJ03DRAFT_326320 [Teratosphaeria nubilosa]
MRKKKEQRTDIWSNLLRQTREAQARSRTQATQHRELLVCGGSPDDQRQFVQMLARPPPVAPPARNRDQRPQKPKGEVRLSNRFAYGYGHMTLYSPPQQGVGVLGSESEEVAGVELHTLPEPEPVYEQTLRRVLDPRKGKDQDAEVDPDEGFAAAAEPTPGEEVPRPAVAILLSWNEPWRFLSLLRRWLQLLARSLLPPDSPHENPNDVLKEHKISLNIVVQHVEAQEALEREGYREESFDYISQCLRTCVLPIAASLVYVSSNPPPQQSGSPLSEVQKVLFTSLGLDLGSLSPAPAKGTAPTKREDLLPKHNVVDRMAVIVPSGWDSLGKIRLLSETFSPEAIQESWTHDLNVVDKPAPTVEEHAKQNTSTPPQVNGGAENPQDEAEVYATSDVGEDDELESRPLSPSQQALSAIATYEAAVVDPNAHKAVKPPSIEVTTKPDQQFLAEMRTHLQELEAQDAERAKNNPSMVSTTAGSLNNARIIGLPAGEQTGALNELGDVSFNVGGVSYNTVTAEAAIERIKRPTQSQSAAVGAESPKATTPRTTTPRPPRREERETSTPVASSSGSNKADLPVEKLEEYFASLMKGGGGAGSSGTPSKPGQ